MKKIAVFASGYGSNFLQINQHTQTGILNAHLAILISDHPEARCVMYAKDHHIPYFAFDPTHYSKRAHYEKEILALLRDYQVDLIVLAGYMRKVGRTLLKAYPKRIINIHPSLLPLFKGKDAIKQAWHNRANETGVTVHYVDEEIDHGEIIIQERLIVNHKTIEELEKDIHQIEHRLYTIAIKHVLEEIL